MALAHLAFFGQLGANIGTKVLKSFAISCLPDTSYLLIKGFSAK